MPTSSSLVYIYTAFIQINAPSLINAASSTFLEYRNDDPKFWANSVDADQTAVCHSVCIFWMYYSMVESHCSNFRIITAIFQVSDYLGVLW